MHQPSPGWRAGDFLHHRRILLQTPFHHLVRCQTPFDILICHWSLQQLLAALVCFITHTRESDVTRISDVR